MKTEIKEKFLLKNDRILHILNGDCNKKTEDWIINEFIQKDVNSIAKNIILKNNFILPAYLLKSPVFKKKFLRKKIIDLYLILAENVINTLFIAVKCEKKAVKFRAKYLIDLIVKLRIQPQFKNLLSNNVFKRAKAALFLRKLTKTVNNFLIKSLKSNDIYILNESFTMLAYFSEYAIEPFLTTIKKDCSEQKIFAIKVLTGIGEKSVNLFINSMKSEYQSIREKAAFMLGKMGRYVIKPLIKALRNHNEWIRVGASMALTNINDRKVIEILEDILLQEEDVNLKCNIVEILGEIGDYRVVGTLLKVLNDDDEQLIWTTVEALGFIGDKMAIKPLLKLLKESNNQETQYYVEGALMQLGVSLNA